jgi:SSS family solute:Na+ symporter
MKSVNIYDYAVVGGYFLFMLGIGVYFMRFNKGAREYFAGGNMIPWWASGMTLYMANFSAWTFSGAAGFTYSTGSFMLIWFSLGSIAYFLGSFLTAKRWRRTRSISPVEYTQTRYNITTQQLLSWVIGINYTLSAGVQLAATSKLLSPVMNLDVTTMTLVTGAVILIYTFLGGLWAVSITDVVQGVILLGTTFIVAPMSLSLVGGIKNLFAALPPLSFDHMYNGVHYDVHWLISILLIMTIGFAAGSGQRFYSVKDEKSAIRVAWFAAFLGLAGPLTFGIPPLVGRVLWPDLSQVDFFRPYIGSNPQDLVYIALCVKLLPNGLIGVFIAAMLAATMSTLSYVYNLVSSIVARDMVQGVFRPETRDDELLRIGRRASVAIGLIVTILAIVFVNSQFGIFNMMQVFFTLFNIPVTVPLCFGLIFRRVPKWSAVASIGWGLLAGVAGRYLLGWDIGPQVYLALVMTFGIFATSYWTGDLYKSNKLLLILLSALVTLGTGVLFTRTIVGPTTDLIVTFAWLCALAFGGSLYGFAKMFALDSEEDQQVVREFFRKLDTPVDVAKEVFGAGKKQISAFPLVGATMIAMGGLLSLIFFTGLHGNDAVIVGALISFMIIFGAAMWYLGKRSEIRGPELPPPGGESA